MNQNSYLIMVEVTAMGPVEDLQSALQRAYTDGYAVGQFQIRVTHEPGYMVVFLRSVEGDAMDLLRTRVSNGVCETLELAAQHLLGRELIQGTTSIAAKPVIDVLMEGDAHIVDFNGVLTA